MADYAFLLNLSCFKSNLKYMSLNRVMLIGNVGKDPEVHYRDNGLCVANVVLATSDRAYTMQNGTQVPERTEWHNLVFWRGLAETVEKYVHKGDKLYVEGSLRSHSYDDQNGVKRYVTEVYVENMEMLTPRQASRPQQSAPQPVAQQAPQPVQQQAPAAPQAQVQNPQPPSEGMPF